MVHCASESSHPVESNPAESNPAESNPADNSADGNLPVLLIGVTGGTGSRAIQGFLDQGMNNLRVMTRRVDLDRPLLRRLQGMGVQLVAGDLDDAASLTAALQDVAAVYCHGLAGDEATADERESV